MKFLLEKSNFSMIWWGFSDFQSLVVLNLRSTFTRKLKGSSVPSIILKHAPDCCDVYVVSSNKLMTNSLNPLLAAGKLKIFWYHNSLSYFLKFSFFCRSGIAVSDF